MKFFSTRGRAEGVTAEEAILQGLAPDGGLFVPEYFPALPPSSRLKNLSYSQLSALVLAPFFSYITTEELEEAAEKAYARFSINPPLALRETQDFGVLELFHGPTLAFKDMALSLLPQLMILAKKHLARREKTLLLTATSGDTGIAAVEGFAGAEGFSTIVFYPKGGVSPLQEWQMVRHSSEGGTVIALEGNFDDAQRGVKSLLRSQRFLEDLEKGGYRAASANSINLARLLAQTVYYVYAGLHAKHPLRLFVPTGNFGNILAAHWAGKMGAPIEELIVATNENDVLDIFFKTGVYDSGRELLQTASPSMDILVSSNLERLLWEVGGEEAVRAAMSDLEENRQFSWNRPLPGFSSGSATQVEVTREIRRVFEEEGLLLDPHTAVAAALRRRRGEKGLIVSTASPFKFPQFVLGSLGESSDGMPMSDLTTLSRISGLELPLQLRELEKASIVQRRVCTKPEMEKTVREVLGV